ncbi:hypothetical protein ABE65_010420 [Fictibacillus phosphorivorans]|uniref:Uncharacterized protein n=1 Tax=Fictibacillus phosphorivorans TaxID=1221500 RepID=A0A160IM57_9BACL|nr:hypothetical protein ABE65_010420 [Fictibacillus phosphorivorans]
MLILASWSLEGFEKGYKQRLAPVQKELFMIGFITGVIYKRLTEEEANEIMDIVMERLEFYTK